MINPEYPQADGLHNKRVWDGFVEKFSPLIRRAIKNRISRNFLSFTESDIDDIHQQAFVQLWKNRGFATLKNPDSISAYIVITAQHCTVDFIRKKRTAFKYSGRSIDSDLIARGSDPRSESHNKEFYETVEGLVNGLPLKERRIIALELFYDFKHREISRFLDIPLNTVSTIIFRIKESLREKLKKRGYYA